jgi:hypothetical protein
MLNPQGRLSIRAMEGASRAAFETRPPEFPEGSQLGAVELRRIPIIRNGEIVAYEERENLIPELAPGVENIIQQRQTAQSIGETYGQESQVWDPVNQRMVRVSRAQALGYDRPSMGQSQPTQAQRGQTGQPQEEQGDRSGVGGFQAEISPMEQTLNLSAQNIFKRTGDEIFDRASKAGERLFQMEELYNAAQSIDPNALTSIAGTLTPYLRLLPGFNDSLAQFGTDFSLLRQRHSRGILRQFESDAAKGNLNKEEVNLFKDSSWQMNDPKEIIQYIAATETALADKDLARRRFYEQYIADGRNPSLFNIAWEKAPENTRVYDHPMFTRFLTDRVNESLSKPLDAQGNRPMPILPPGHKLVQNNQGQLGIRNPDGRVIPIGQ